jgi:LysR family cyn operon transcriptional activator
MELRHLKYFLSIAREKSFTRASEELFVTQPTLSHQVKQLEEELGCELFDRSSRNVRLTSAGEIFSDFASRALREVESGRIAIQEYQGLRAGSLTIGVVSSFIDSLMPPVLSSFHALYPNIRLKVLELPTDELQRCVRDGELAFGIAYGPAVIEHLTLEPLFKEELMVIVSRKHRLAQETSVSLGALQGMELALLTTEYVSRKMLDSAFMEALVSPRIAVEMNSIGAILETVARSDLATIMPKRAILHSRHLVSVPLRPTIKRTAALITRSPSSISPAAHILSEMFRSAYQRIESELRPASKKGASGRRNSRAT